jgi:presenilin-like A22 family membrane protease
VVVFMGALAAVDSIDLQASAASQSVTGAWAMGAALVGVAIALLLLVRTTRGTAAAGALFALALFMGVGMALSGVLGTGVSVLGVAIAAILYYTDPPIWAFDLIVGIGIAGIAAAFAPGLTPEFVLIVTLLLGAYDALSVHGPRRITAIMLRRPVFFAMILPDAVGGFRMRLTAAADSSRVAFIGVGDLMLPALLAASFAARYGLEAAVPLIAGAVLGRVAADVLYAKGKGAAMPVLPPVAAGALIGYFSSLLLH